MSDLIWRQDAIDALGEEPMVWNDTDEELAERNRWKRDVDAIRNLSSVQKTGQQRDYADGFADGYKQGLKDAQKTEWIPCSERLPERIINGNVETVQEFFVTVKERWQGEEWSYDTDIAEFSGDYIDDIWQTYNDWREGQEVHVIAWMPMPEPYKDGGGA